MRLATTIQWAGLVFLLSLAFSSGHGGLAVEPNIVRLSADRLQVTFSKGDSRSLLTWREALKLFQAEEGQTFREQMSKILRDAPFSGIFFECSPVSRETQFRTFEFVVSDAPHHVQTKANIADFSEHLGDMKGTMGFKTFPSLSGTSWMISPAEYSNETSHYGHLASFVRGAPAEQQDALWRELGNIIDDAFKKIPATSGGPIWISTEGSAVPWLHLRIDPRPKYYKWQPYKNPDHGLQKDAKNRQASKGDDTATLNNGVLIEMDVFKAISTWVNDILQAFRSDTLSPSDFARLKASKLQDIAYSYGATKDEVDAALDEDDAKTALVDLLLTKVPPKECSELCESVRERWAAVKEAAYKIARGFDGVKHSINDQVGRVAQDLVKHVERVKDKITKNRHAKADGL